MINQLIEDNEISIKCHFVPHSMSRHSKDKPELNWTIKLIKGYEDVIITDYSAGTGNIEWEEGKKGSRLSAHMKATLEAECCEDGYAVLSRIKVCRAVEPTIQDILYALVSCDYIQQDNFEEWCLDFGYNHDSISQLAIFHTCQSNSQALLDAFGSDLICSLQEALQDY